MPLAGEQLSIKEALALCNVVGFEPKDLDVAVAVMTAESGRFTKAWHDNLDAAGMKTSTDRGLYQLNDRFHPGVSDEEAYDPKANAAYAFQLSSQGKDWTPWMAFTSGAHEKYLSTITEVRTTTDWRSRKKLWQ